MAGATGGRGHGRIPDQDLQRLLDATNCQRYGRYRLPGLARPAPGFAVFNQHPGPRGRARPGTVQPLMQLTTSRPDPDYQLAGVKENNGSTFSWAGWEKNWAGWERCEDMKESDTKLLQTRDLAIPRSESQEESVHQLCEEDKENIRAGH